MLYIVSISFVLCNGQKYVLSRHVKVIFKAKHP